MFEDDGKYPPERTLQDVPAVSLVGVLFGDLMAESVSLVGVLFGDLMEESPHALLPDFQLSPGTQPL